MPQFGRPEMQRCALDKLILQIKMWNFQEPQILLGGAIEPPNLSDIATSIRRIQEIGALTLPIPDKSPTGELTFMGRILCDLPCDIRIGRLFLFGLTLGCMKQAIIMGCILQQDKSLFQMRRRGNISHQQDYIKFSYAQNYDSDIIMLMNIYYDWYNTFIKQIETEAQNEGRDGRFMARRLIRQKIFGQKAVKEVEWCKNKWINKSILKEVYILIHEVKQRFLNFNIPEETLNMEVPPDSDGILILKVALAAAFFPKYLKPFHKDLEYIKKFKKMVENSYGNPCPGKSKRTIELKR
jgi:ATP-dependent RNA helicase TDRD9